MKMAGLRPAVVVSIALALPAAPCIGAAESSLEIALGVRQSGEATDQWLAMIRRRLPAPEYAQIASLAKPLSAQEREWAELIRSRRAVWNDRRPMLADLFAPVRAPERVLIVVGNRGGADAFTHDPTTIGFDLSALQEAYGDASLPENPGRIDRFFDHEYTHLMQKAWLAERPYPTGSALRAALLDIWLEGLGQYRSLSDRWRVRDGTAPGARATLDLLEPRFVARMSALACASSEAAGPLMEELSEGRFERKWGALPSALWLEAEASLDPGALRSFVLAGPDGVWELAGRRLPSPLREVLKEARLAASICSATGAGAASSDPP